MHKIFLFRNKFYFLPLHVSSYVKYWDKYTEMHGQQNVKICDLFTRGIILLQNEREHLNYPQNDSERI